MKIYLSRLVACKTALTFSFALSILGLSASAQAFQSTCPVNHLKNLNYQLLITSRTGTLKRVNIPRKSIYIDKQYGELVFDYDVRKLLKTKAFRHGIAKYTLSTKRPIKVKRDIEVITGLAQFNNRKARVSNNPDPSKAPPSFILFTEDKKGNYIDESNFKEFSKNDRVKVSFRPDRKLRRAMDVIYVQMFCSDEDFELEFGGDLVL